MTLTFVHLRVHSAYSLAEGAIKVKALPGLCQQHGMPAIGITDTMNLFGALEIALACAEKGIQPIIGCQVHLKVGDMKGPWVLLTQSEVGYKNLMALVSQAYLRAETPQEAHLTWADLEAQSTGLLALTGGADGIVGQWLAQEKHEEARQFLIAAQALYGDRLYIELERHGHDREEQCETPLVDLAYALHLPLVATNNVYFPYPDLYQAHDALLCIAEGSTISQTDRRRVTPEHYFKSVEEMTKLFEDIPEALQNTLVIAQRCHFMPRDHPPMLPHFKASSGRDEVEELRFQAHDGLKKRMGETIPEAYQDRLFMELQIIERMGFSGYFLIVADFIQWAKSQGIPVGPGRGSGAGSLAAWSLTITDMDPIRFGLIFERFLNPERVSMPDFDVDFCQDRRDEVVVYVRDKYGEARVAHIITFGKLQARAALRDVGRVLEMSYTQVDKLCKLIPNNPANPVTIEQALEMEPLLQQARQEDIRVDQLMEIAIQLEGLYRHASTHAAGVVIGGRPLVEIIPLYKDDRSFLPVTQFSMKYVEAAGLLKFDFLGLKTLTVIEKCCELIRTKGVPLHITDIPLDDPNTFALFCRVEVVGVFQVESSGMRDVLRRLRPDRFEDLVVLVALYRPGPMDDIPRYLACKHGEEEITYLHPLLTPILEATYGVMVYQEQVMQIAQTLGGYSLGAADLLRRAMGKKIKAEMDAQRSRFIAGAVENGVTPEIASQIFDQMARFAGYGFNKSHSAPYALLTYQTAYLKANYPLEFFAASMTCDLGNSDKLMVFRQDLQRKGIPLYPPDITLSQVAFQVEGEGIRYALAAIKNVGEQAMAHFVQVRDCGGPFASLQDVLQRIDPKTINKRQMESLIAAGAFDRLHPNRHQLFKQVDVLLRFAQDYQAMTQSRQGSLFGTAEDIPLRLAPLQDWGPLERLQHEFQALGFFLSAHPLDGYAYLMQRQFCLMAAQFGDTPEGVHRLAGIILSKQERISKTGNKFAFLQLSDPTGFYEVVLFSDVLARYRAYLEPGQALFITANLRREGEGVRLTTQNLEPLDDVLARTHPIVKVTTTAEVDRQALQVLIEAMPKGQTTIHICLPLENGTAVDVCLPQRYTVTQAIRNQFFHIPGVVGIVDC